ncbi:MAG: DUF5320 domain-containing protein [Deltaproteobacteria bacterium]|nr:DUF5320 domain-containing protein [Deltaproteobacteria bacterium]
MEQDLRVRVPEPVEAGADADPRRPVGVAAATRAAGQGRVATEAKVKTKEAVPAEVAGVGFREKEVFNMPGFDRTGPQGAGPMTGGARGYCNPATAGYVPRYGMRQGYGRGLGRGRGFGAGYGRGFRTRGYGAGPVMTPPPAYAPPPMDSTQELSMLKSEADGLKRALDDIHRRIDELETEGSE